MAKIKLSQAEVDAFNSTPNLNPTTGIARGVGDLGVNLLKGTLLGGKMLSDAVTANNPVSNVIQSGIEGLDSLRSQGAKDQDIINSARMANAEQKGGFAEVGAALKNFSQSPLDTIAQGAGTIVPALAAQKLGAGAATKSAISTGVGTAMGAGAIKGEVYDAVKKAHIDAGKTEQEADALATEAQSYTGKNADQIALGAGLGALAGGTGVESIAARLGAKEIGQEAGQFIAKDLLKKTLSDASKEAIPEAIQGGQERVATNVAQARDGFDVDTWQGVAGNATLEGLAAAPLGGGLGAAEYVINSRKQLATTLAQTGSGGAITGAAQTAVLGGASDQVLALPAPTFENNDLVVFPDGSTMTRAEAEKRFTAEELAAFQARTGTTPKQQPTLALPAPTITVDSQGRAADTKTALNDFRTTLGVNNSFDSRFNEGVSNANRNNDASTTMATNTSESTGNNAQGSVADLPIQPNGTGMGDATATPPSSIGTNVATGNDTTGGDAVEARPFESASDDLLGRLLKLTDDTTIKGRIEAEMTLRGLKPATVDAGTTTLPDSTTGFNISNVKRKNGAIGTQGVTQEQVAGVLKHGAGMDIKDGATMREMVDLFKADKEAQNKLREFNKSNPIEVNTLPDGTFHLQDGHHRTFLIDQIGDTTIPAKVDGVLKSTVSPAQEFAPVKESLTTQDNPVVEEATTPENANIQIAHIGSKGANQVISLKPNGDNFNVLHNGDELLDYEGDPVTVKKTATLDEIKAAVKASGQFNKQIITYNKDYQPSVENVDAGDTTEISVDETPKDVQVDANETENVNVVAPDGWENHLIKARTYAKRLIDAGVANEGEFVEEWLDKDKLVEKINSIITSKQKPTEAGNVKEEPNDVGTTGGATGGTISDNPKEPKKEKAPKEVNPKVEKPKVEVVDSEEKPVEKPAEKPVKEKKAEPVEQETTVLSAVESGDIAWLTSELYKGVLEVESLQPSAMPTVFPDDYLIRISLPLNNSDVTDGVLKNLKRLKFRVTDKLQETAESEVVVVSAMISKASGVDDAGNELGGKIKGQAPQKPDVGSDEKKLLKEAEKWLDALHKKNYLDQFSNEEQTFGTMMFKEAIFEHIRMPLEYIASQLKAYYSYSYKATDKSIVTSSLADVEMSEKANVIAGNYVKFLNDLQATFHSASTVESARSAFVQRYLKEEGGNLTLTEEGKPAASIFDTSSWRPATGISNLVNSYANTFGKDENSTDQTNRLVKKDPDVPPRLDNITRVGMKDHRGGKDIDTDAFTSAFGFSGLEFGEWVNQIERQQNLNLAYDSLYDLSSITGIDANIVSVAGKLGLAIGSRGSKNTRAAAHFEPTSNVINLTKTNGNGTVGHEWFHGLDHNIETGAEDSINATKYRGVINLLSNTLSSRIHSDRLDAYLRGVLRDANNEKNRSTPPKDAVFAKINQQGSYATPVHEYVKEQTQFKKEADNLDRGKSKAYWGTKVEMLARGFESFLFDKTKGGSPYLVGKSRADGYMTKKNGYAGTPYPTGEERAYIASVYENFFALIDGKTLKFKTYKVEPRIVEVEGLGFGVIDQHNVGTKFLYSRDSLAGTINWFSTKEIAQADADKIKGTERILDPQTKQVADANKVIIDFVQNLDKIMEEMNIVKFPELKNGSMAESMFFHLKQGWFPEDNRAIKDYVAKAYRIKPADVDLLKLKQGQEDFEAALAKFAGQKIVDMRLAGSDEKAIFDELLSLYNKQPNLDVRTSTSASNQAYSTPLPISFIAGQLGRVNANSKVIDPSGGNGLLLINANPKNITTIELEKHRALNMKLMEFGKVIDGDAVKQIDTINDQAADVILTNPPFGSLASPVGVPSWDGRNYMMGKIDHLIAAKSLRTLADKGRAVIILGANKKVGAVNSNDKVFLNWLYANYNVADHFEVDGSMYARQGAAWPLRVLVIAGRNQTESAYDMNNEVERVFNYEQLWSRYVEAHKNSERILVDSSKASRGFSSTNSGSGQLPNGNQEQAGNSDRNGGAEGSDSNSENDPRGSGSDTNGKTTERGTPSDDADGQNRRRGNDKTGRPRQGGIGNSGSGKTSGTGASPTDAGGLSELSDNDIENIFGEVFDSVAQKKSKSKGKRTLPELIQEKKESKGKVFGNNPVVNKKSTGDKELDAIFAELDEVVDGKSTQQESSDASENKTMFSRSSNEEELSNYEEYKPFFKRIMEVMRKKYSDIKEQIKAFANAVLARYGAGIKAYAMRFVSDIKQEQENTPSSKKPIIPDPVDNESQVVYRGRSNGDSGGIYVPRKQADALYSALDLVEAENGDLDEFVMEELGYDSKEAMYKALGGYQIDALALAISANKNGNGFIIGDDTGVGKGRTAAGLMAWAVKSGKIPVFMTIKPDLYTAMYEDLQDIGKGDIKIAITNSKEEIKDSKGRVVLKSTPQSAKALYAHIIKTGELPDGAQALFTTYSQFNNPKLSAMRRDAVATLVRSEKAVIIMDEAHNAAGESQTGEFIRNLITGNNLFGVDIDGVDVAPPDDFTPPAVTYLSATFAKRPTNMPVYMRTHLAKAADSIEELISAFSGGGDVLQQIASEMLVKSGSMIRRERSYEGVKFGFITDEKNAERDERLVDEVTNVLRSIVRADREFAAWAESEDGRKTLATLMPKGYESYDKNGKLDTAMSHGLFTSVVHNYVSQLLLSTKVDSAVNYAIEAINRGEKAVFALQNTMGSALDDYTSIAGINVGDELKNFGWQTILTRGLTSARRLAFKSPTGNKSDTVRVIVPMNMLPYEIAREFQRGEELIESFKSSLPASPIDMIRFKMSQYSIVTNDDGTQYATKTPPKGANVRPLNISEITGRDKAVDYSTEVPTLVKRKDPDNVDIIRGYANGSIDTVILNSSGATGISLHASEKFKDQRPRHMIFLQPNPDIAVFKQTIGRIHRTGQVEWPTFTVLATGIPAERRILAVLKKKMKSLFSNTSSGKGSTEIDAVDFLNIYGDKIVAEYLSENDDVAGFLSVDISSEPEGTDIALTASGRASLLSVSEQNDFFNTVEERFNQEIEMRNATGTNTLEMKEYDYQASALETTMIEEGMDESNPFTESVFATKYAINVIGDIPTPEKVQTAIDSALGGRTSSEVVDDLVESLKMRYDEAYNQLVLRQSTLNEERLDEKATESEKKAIDDRLASIKTIMDGFATRREQTINALKYRAPIGGGYNSVIVNDIESEGVVVGYSIGKSTSKAGNPFSPSNIIVHIQRNVPNGRISIPLSKIESGSGISVPNQANTYFYLEDMFRLRSVNGGKENRYIITGNLVRFRTHHPEGDIIKFTLDGHTPENPMIESGILMPEKYKLDAGVKSGFSFRSKDAASEYLLSLMKYFNNKKYESTDYEFYKDRVTQIDGMLKINSAVSEELGEELRYGNVMTDSKKAILIYIDRYSGEVKFSVDTKIHPKLFKSKALVALIGDLSKRRNESYAQSNGISDPLKVKALIDLVYRFTNLSATESAVDYARDIAKRYYSGEKSGSASVEKSTDTPTFSRSKSENKGLPKVSVQIAVNKLRSGWKNAPEIIVVDDMNDPAIRKAVRDENQRQLSQGAKGHPEGFYDDGKVYILASEMNSPKDVIRVVFHETLGHYGLRGLYGKELGAILDQVAMLRKNDMAKKAKQYGLDLNKVSDRRIVAEEVLAEMAQTAPSAGFVKRAIAAIRNFLRSIGVNLEFSDNDIIVNYLLPARRFVVNGGGGGGGGGVKLSRDYSVNDAQLFKELTLNDDMFKYTKSSATDMQKVFDDVVPQLVRVDVAIAKDGVEEQYAIYPRDTKGKALLNQEGTISVYPDGNVEINVAAWDEGYGGSGVYSAVANWAYNNGKVFAGDRDGITSTGKLRRLENMVSMALKFGTTDHIAPHQDQERELGINWIKGDTENNIAELLKASYKAIRNGIYVTEKRNGYEVTYKSPNALGVAKLDDLVYDFDKQQFIELSSGKPYTDKEFRVLAESREARATHAGSTTLKRAVIAHTFLREKSGEKRQRLLELVGKLAYQSLENTQLNEIFYSRANQAQTETPQFKSWFGDSKVVDADGKPLVVYHGTAFKYTYNRDEARYETKDKFNTFEPKVGKRSLGFLGAEKEVTSQAFFFTPNKQLAREFGRAKADDSGKSSMNDYVYATYLSINNPYDLTLKSKSVVSDLKKAGYSKEEIADTSRINLWQFLDDERFVSYLKSQGYDGVKLLEKNYASSASKTPEISYAVFSPTQIKSATGNNGNFDANNNDIRFSRSNSSWNNPEPSKLDSVIYALQDKHIDLKRVTDSIKKAGADIADQFNAYLQEELYHGRTAKRTQDFIKHDLDPLIEDMRARGVAMADFEEYLWARHAEERNIQIAKVNPDMPDGGSGMDTQDARDYLSNLTAEQKANYTELAKRIDAINRKSRQTLIDYGLESEKTIEAWQGAYKNYVPLMREDMDNGFGNGTGQGFSVKGNASKRATGSNRAVVDIIANMAQQFEKNVIRGEKNRVSKALIGLAKLNPNKEFWKVDSPPKIKTVVKGATVYEVLYHGSKVQEFTNLAEANKLIQFEGKNGYTINTVKKPDSVQEVTDPNYKNLDNVVVARFKTEKGDIVERAVVFNKYDERSMRMAASVKNLDQDQIGELLGAASSFTRYFASINTQYNPIFGVVNIVRDVQGALLNLSTTPIANKKSDVLKNTPSALLGIYKDLRSERKNGVAGNSQWSQLFEDYQNEGGQTGFRDMYANAKERGESLQNALDPLWWQNSKIGKLISANGLLAKPEQWMYDKAIKPIFDWLSDYNTALENAVRLSVYKVALDNGHSKQQAASMAKNISVNFNRKGEMGRQIGSLYAFFNASVQGTARIGETMLEKDANGKVKLSAMGKRIVQGGLLLGAMQALLLSAAGYGDDEPPEFVRDRSLVIPLGDSYITVPMPLGFNAIPSLGRIVTEWALSGGEDTQKRLVHIMDMILNVTNPIGNAGLSIQTITPTVIDPLAALAENKDFTGRPIAREDFNSLNPTAGFTRSRDKAWDLSVAIAQAINYMTGGNDYKQGAISPTADQLEYLAGQFTGGVGREIIKAGTTADSLFTGEELPTYKVPLVGRFYGDVTGQASQGDAFYTNVRIMNEYQNEMKGIAKEGGDIAKFMESHPEARLARVSDLALRQVQNLRKQQRAIKEAGGDNREAVKVIDERITQIMKRLNDNVTSIKEGKAV
jgi:hypothetical protein